MGVTAPEPVLPTGCPKGEMLQAEVRQPPQRMSDWKLGIFNWLFAPTQQEEESSRWVTLCSWLRPLPWAGPRPVWAKPQSSALAPLPMGTVRGAFCSPLCLQELLERSQGAADPEGARAELPWVWESWE